MEIAIPVATPLAALAKLLFSLKAKPAGVIKGKIRAPLKSEGYTLWEQ